MFALIMTLEGQAKKAIPAAEYEAMLSGIAREDSAAFERFYRSTDRTLYTYILSLTRNHHDAQDVMMDTYLKVRANAHRYVPQGKPLAWVFTIARNLVRSRQREAARYDAYMQELADYGPEDIARAAALVDFVTEKYLDEFRALDM